MKDLIQKAKIFCKQIFSVNNFDNHLSIYIFGLRIRKKLKPIKKNIVIRESGLNNLPREKRVIASLTTFPERINTVKETIKSLLVQTIKPDEVILWLADSQFPQKENELPKDLLELKDYGLTIKWCEDIRSFKKLIPALIDYPNDIIITFDDDIYYPETVIELLYNSYLENPNCIHANRGRRIELKNNKIIAKSAAEVYWTKYEDCTYKNSITGCGGVLYPPNSLDKRVLNKEEFQSILKTQDDVWFWTMAVLKGTKIKRVANFDIQLPTVENTQQFGLSKINSKNSKGISSLDGFNLVLQRYPEIRQVIEEENNDDIFSNKKNNKYNKKNLFRNIYSK